MQHVSNQELLIHLNMITQGGQNNLLAFLASLSKPTKRFLCIEETISVIKENKALAEHVYLLTHNEFKNYGFRHDVAEKIVTGLANSNALKKECSFLEKSEIFVVTILDDDYPRLLKNIHNPPLVLYYRGTLPSTIEHSLAIVGSRLANSYAEKVIDMLMPELAMNGMTIVSGGALGVDTLAHQAALTYKASTVVVLGSGLYNVYPSQNKKLFERIITEGGALLSPFPIETEPLPFNFPSRNRIIAGLSKGCLVVQAAQKSGSLITANIALEEGRNVFAIPGSIFDALSYGCHELLKQGAKGVTSAKDILEECGEPSITVHNSIQNNVIAYVEESVTVDSDPILRYLKTPKSIDELCLELSESLEKMQEILFNLQLAGKVEQSHAGLWYYVSRS